MKKIFIYSLVLLFLILPNYVYANTINEVNIYFFYKDSCDICKQEEVYLEALKERYSNMRVYSYEVSDSNNYDLMTQAKNLYNETKSGVPYTVIGDSSYLGFSQSNKAIFQKRVYEYSLNKYSNKLGNLLGISYNQIEGEVKEYKTNDDYQIEETSGKTHTTSTTTKSNNYSKYKSSIILVSIGVILGITVIIIRIVEKRKEI